MKSILKNRKTRNSILLIALASMFQPFIVLGTEYGRSNKCLNCSIPEQTLLPSVIYLILPLAAIYVLTKKIGINRLLQALVMVVYFITVSFVTLTVPLFDDRIAAWSTFSNEEVWNTAMYMARPSMGILSLTIFVLLATINKHSPTTNAGDLLDQNGDINGV